MRYLVTAQEMKQYDTNTIEKLGIPGPVLMERAALACFDALTEHFSDEDDRPRVLVFVGVGNNGGDGLALARLLSEQSMDVSVCTVGDPEKASVQWAKQRSILSHYPVKLYDFETEFYPMWKKEASTFRASYDAVVDAIFGVGLSRPVEGSFSKAISCMNELKGFKLAIDVPSGISSDTGDFLGNAFVADRTVTFGFCKRGLVCYPGADYAGCVTVAEVGINRFAFEGRVPRMFTYDEDVKFLLPRRDPAGNKGTFGKVLLIAGTDRMAGAAILSAKACARCGAGMVKVVSPEVNREILQTALPEALYERAEAFLIKSVGNSLSKAAADAFAWADVIAIGPGLGQDARARELLGQAITYGSKPILLDADALNLLARDDCEELADALAAQGEDGREIVMTPHMGELARLLHRPVMECKYEPLAAAIELAGRFHCTVAAKDARTIVLDNRGPAYLNLSGNNGMATAGSGDVLAGVIASFLAQEMDAFDATSVGVYLHGLAGDTAADAHTSYGMTAGDIVEAIPKVIAAGRSVSWEPFHGRVSIE